MAAVFVLPTGQGTSAAPVAAFLSTAGWAAAGARVLGGSWIVCPSGIIDPAEARRRASPPLPAGSPRIAGGSDRDVPASVTRGAASSGVLGTTSAALRRLAPPAAKTLAKDVRARHRAHQFRIDPAGPWSGQAVDFVWQRHELFHTAGLDLARSLGAPSVLFVPATKVWEAERWGTTRPGWGAWVESDGERPALQRADLVACGSQEVAEQATRLGAREERILITPTGVDLDLFDVEPEGRDRQRETLGLTGRFVVGWAGSFQPFHAVERAIDAVATIPDASLLLVGDGPERATLEAAAARAGVHAVFTGRVSHSELPRYLGAMDVGVILSRGAAGFHYSPLKLGEYLASGLAVVAPAVRPVARRLTDGVDALLVAPGDAGEFREALARLHADPELRAQLARRGRQAARDHWSWDQQVHRVLDALGTPPSA